MKTTSFLLLLAIWFLNVRANYAQNSLGIGTSSPSTNAVVDIVSTTKGFLMPRYASTEGNSVPAVAGMLFYDTTKENIMLHTGSGWATQGFMPVGAITMWTGATPPAGWALCDGTKGTPNLQGKFIVGYDPGDSDYSSIGNAGGQNWVTLDLNHLPSHTHSVNDPGHSHSASLSHRHSYSVEEYSSGFGEKGMINEGGSPSSQQSVTASSSSFSATVSVSPTTIGASTTGYYGGNTAIDNRPPYYVLAFIMKITEFN